MFTSLKVGRSRQSAHAQIKLRNQTRTHNNLAILHVHTDQWRNTHVIKARDTRHDARKREERWDTGKCYFLNNSRDFFVFKMGKADFLSPKAIGNRIKAKGLQKLRWYCQMCQKQCRDEVSLRERVFLSSVTLSWCVFIIIIWMLSNVRYGYKCWLVCIDFTIFCLVSCWLATQSGKTVNFLPRQHFWASLAVSA